MGAIQCNGENCYEGERVALLSPEKSEDALDEIIVAAVVTYPLLKKVEADKYASELGSTRSLHWRDLALSIEDQHPSQDLRSQSKTCTFRDLRSQIEVRSQSRISTNSSEPSRKSSTGTYISWISWKDNQYTGGSVAGDGAFAYRNCELVEYFSSSHRHWLLGTMELEVVGKLNDSAIPDAMYNVRIGKGQCHENVPLDCLRQPIKATELLDAYSKRDGGTWMGSGSQRFQLRFGKWMPAEAVGRTPLLQPLRHYRARILASGHEPEQFHNLPAVKLRRRFFRGMSVSVYRGPPHGWIPAVVHSAIETAPVDPPVPLSRFSPGGPQCMDALEASSENIVKIRRSSTPTAEEGLMSNPWVQVPVFEEAWDHWLDFGSKEKEPEWIPSYLLRPRMTVEMTESNDPGARRQYAF